VLSRTFSPVDGALVRVSSHAETAVTDSLGNWTMDVQLGAKNEMLTIEAMKPGYDIASVEAFVQQGEATVAPTIVLPAAADSDTTSVPVARGNIGAPTNIVLRLVAPPTLGVHGSGENETNIICFGAQDAQGHAMDLAHKVTLEAWITNPLDNEEKLTPSSAETDEHGNVIFVLQSGTVAGVAQVKCRVRGTNVTSSPVPVVVHGGLPDSAHFAVAPELLNIPGLVHLGVTDRMTAYVGDKYANPTRPGAAVYFTSNAGIIQGSSFADALGQASVLLESAAPDPPTGFVDVTARTADWNEKQIETHTTVLFSGPTVLSVTPETFYLGPTQSQDFLITLSDPLGHPLAGGTSIAVSATKGSVSGDVAVTIPDTQSEAWTQFYVTLENDTTGTASASRSIPRDKNGRPLIRVNMHPTLTSANTAGAKRPPIEVDDAASMTVTVTSPNGNAQKTVRGTFITLAPQPSQAMR
jgi:hypothetical protein